MLTCLMLLLSACSMAPVKKTVRTTSTQKTDSKNESSTANVTPADAQSNSDTQADGDTLPPTILSKQPPANLWVRLRRGFRLNGENRPEVQRWIAFYTNPPTRVEHVLQRATPYLWRITQAVDKRNMPLEIALLPAVESGFNPYAYSHSDAAGLWQFIPSTARRFGLRSDWWYDGRRDIPSATKAALNYLEYLHSALGTWPRALAAYNCGEGCIQGAMQLNVSQGKPVDYWDLPLRNETANYVPKLLAVAAIVAHPKRYNVTLPTLPNSPHLKLVSIPGQMDLTLAAKLADVSVRKILQLNPGYNRWATDPHGPHRLLIPANHARHFKTALANLPKKDLVRWHRHRIQRGDTLIALAHHYNTTVPVLKQINHLSGTRIRVGHELLIPASMHSVNPGTMALIARRRRLANAPYRRRQRLVHYRVKQGDTLWDVSRAHSISVSQIARWNGISRHAVLHPGETLVLHNTGSAHAMAVSRQRPHTVYYTVSAGDSLYAIAQQFDVTVRDIERWNNMAGHTIRPGQRLKVEVGRNKKYSS